MHSEYIHETGESMNFLTPPNLSSRGPFIPDSLQEAYRGSHENGEKMKKNWYNDLIEQK